MKKLISAIRDFLYNITDYGLIITVIVIMVAVLGWRFDILFNRTIDKEVIASLPDKLQSGSTIPNNPDNTEDETEIPDQIAENPEETNETVEHGNQLIATINIPEGSFPSSIGEILIESNLIYDKNEFMNKSIEMGLDTKLQSGTFEITVGTTVDNIIRIIAKAN